MWGLCLESPVSLNSNSHETLRENGHDSYQAQGCFFFFFPPSQDKISLFSLLALYISSWPGTSASRVLGLKVCTTTAWQVQGFSRIAYQHHLCFETQGKLFI